MHTFDTYTSEFGIGYRVFIDGVLSTDQPFAPGLPGFVGMTQTEAEAAAQAEIDARTAPVEA